MVRPRKNSPRTKAGKTSEGLPTADYRHAAKTKNLPPAGLAAEGKIEQPRKVQYAYNAHLLFVHLWALRGGDNGAGLGWIPAY